ncbi:MAG: P1 family peptidase [Chloroflexota bacterium]
MHDDPSGRSPHGSICDVPGVKVGHATDLSAVTGCTVVLCERGAVGGVDVRGAAPGTRETDLLRPENTVERVHAVLLTGGSAYGLDAAAGVMAYLEERGVGFDVRSAVVPIVPAAVIFDLGIGDPRVRPDRAMGLAACQSASSDPPSEGSVGAGTGATVSKLGGPSGRVKGGAGSASVRVAGGTVGALVVVNAVGHILDDDGSVLAGRAALTSATPDLPPSGPAVGESTTIGVVATDLPLDKAGTTRLAQAAHDGLARAVAPAHTAMDGDAFFALSTAHGQQRTWPVPPEVTAAAADVVAVAIRRAVRLATGLGGVPAVSEGAADGR